MLETFGCCSKYRECSDEKVCLHVNEPEYAGCQYRQNLEDGLIFYGKNNTCKGDQTMENLKISIEVNAPELTAAIIKLAEAISSVNALAPINALPIVKTEPDKAEPEKPKKATKSKEDKPAEPPKTEEKPNGEVKEEIEEEKQGEEPTYTIEQVRAKLRSLSDNGKATEMKQIITSFGVTKVSEIPADKYGEVIKLVEKVEKGDALE